MDHRLGNLFLSFNMTFDSTESLLVLVLRSGMPLSLELEDARDLTKKL
jgi:hypothetical protein